MENKEQQDINVVFKDGTSILYKDVQGYQIGGGVLALSLSPILQEIYNMDGIVRIVKHIATVEE